ncbi:hypothetical protein [Synechococcus sp. BA-132 BA5]|uniref:hypothetical protein n=1 Tax=Synechococcus sp. BA-132 BA5 TaxID=3110252 RepID=UPI002B1F36C5|nr:hypothetical protein [Synechococcus sp. BA-132 BA5]MEA5416021.1 hypothetical protein [Synechococcus sp. BA-132 BA5]
MIFYSEKLTKAMTQTTDDSPENQEGPDLRKLLSTMDLESVLLQAEGAASSKRRSEQTNRLNMARSVRDSSTPT